MELIQNNIFRMELVQNEWQSGVCGCCGDIRICFKVYSSQVSLRNHSEMELVESLRNKVGQGVIQCANPC